MSPLKHLEEKDMEQHTGSLIQVRLDTLNSYYLPRICHFIFLSLHEHFISFNCAIQYTISQEWALMVWKCFRKEQQQE